MSKKQVSDSDLGYGCVYSLILGGIALVVLINLCNFKMSFWLVLFSLFIGAFIVQLVFLIWRNSSSVEQTECVEDLTKISRNDLDDCNQLCNAFVKFMLQTQADKVVMNSIRKIKGLETVDQYRFGAFNPRIFIMVIHDMLKCYNVLGFNSGSDILCCTLVYYRSATDPNECLDYTTAIIKHDELCNLGNAVINVIKTLNVSGFDGDTDFMLAGALNNYEHDSTEYLNLLHDLASYIIKKYGLETITEVADYTKRIVESNSIQSQICGENKLNIDDLVGLDEVKREVHKFSDFISVQHLRAKEGLKLLPVNYHCVFTGNPGTGKTTVARILADVYKDLGILKKGHLVETDRSGLVAEYVGQTAVKTNKIIDSALDGVLFIDEAYSLVSAGSGDYGLEAIATLLKRMEDNRDRLVVILAGYCDEMKEFIESNPGLKSRFNRYFHFSDYTAPELWEIFKRNLIKHEYVLDIEAERKVKQILSDAVSQKDTSFGNARFVRNLSEKILENQATRIATEKSTDRSSLQRIMISDIENITIGYK